MECPKVTRNPSLPVFLSEGFGWLISQFMPCWINHCGWGNAMPWLGSRMGREAVVFQKGCWEGIRSCLTRKISPTKGYGVGECGFEGKWNILGKSSPWVLKDGKEKGERRDPLGDTKCSCWNVLYAPATGGGLLYQWSHHRPHATNSLISH